MSLNVLAWNSTPNTCLNPVPSSPRQNLVSSKPIAPWQVDVDAWPHDFWLKISHLFAVKKCVKWNGVKSPFQVKSIWCKIIFTQNSCKILHKFFLNKIHTKIRHFCVWNVDTNSSVKILYKRWVELSQFFYCARSKILMQVASYK